MLAKSLAGSFGGGVRGGDERLRPFVSVGEWEDEAVLRRKKGLVW
jgi:hypothetical protein